LIRESLADTVLTPEMRAEIDHWISKYPPDRKQSAVIPALHICQESNGGWLKQEHLDAVAEYLEMPNTVVYEVANFYSMFDLKPCGRHKVNICTNISCMLRGAEQIVDYAEKKLGIRLGETTADGRITLKIEEECLAACVGAPMMVVDGHYYTDLTPEKVDEILDKLE
jgi:NADH-quinone oxidoreductase subunit E